MLKVNEKQAKLKILRIVLSMAFVSSLNPTVDHGALKISQFQTHLC